MKFIVAVMTFMICRTLALHHVHHHKGLIGKHRCGEPKLIEPMTVVLSQDVANYSCPMGLALVGTKISYCRKDCTWSSPTPECKVPDCEDDVPVIPFATATLKGGETATLNYKCDEGFKMEGDDYTPVKCVDGAWEKPKLTCVPIMTKFQYNLRRFLMPFVVAAIVGIPLCSLILIAYTNYKSRCWNEDDEEENTKEQKEPPRPVTPYYNPAVMCKPLDKFDFGANSLYNIANNELKHSINSSFITIVVESEEDKSDEGKSDDNKSPLDEVCIFKKCTYMCNRAPPALPEAEDQFN